MGTDADVIDAEMVDDSPDTDERDRAVHEAWQDGATFDELCSRYGLDRAGVRRIVFARQIERTPGRDMVLASAAPTEDEGGALVVSAVRYLPEQYRGDGPPPPGSPQHVIDNWLPDSAKRLILRGKSPHTVRAYLAAFGWWTKFAKANGLTIMPAPQNGMIRMLDAWELLPVHVGCSGRKQADGKPCTGHRPSPSAAWIWFSAMKWFHGLGEPPIPWEGGVKLSDAIRGYITQLKDDGWRQTKAPRAYPKDVRAMVDALDAMPAVEPEEVAAYRKARKARKGKDSDDAEVTDDGPVWIAPARVDMLRALVLACFYTGGRASDLARYRITDIERFETEYLNDDGELVTARGIELTLSQSKATRGDRNEEKRTINEDIDAHTGQPSRYCGVAAMERWVDRLAANGITGGAIFRPVHKSGVIVRGAPDTLAYMADVTGLTRAVRLVAKAAWLASGKKILKNWRTFSIHSTRRGRVQQLLELGVDIWDVEEALGWAHGGAVKFYRAEIKRRSPQSATAKGML
ncbi:MAG: hypothetical protein EPO06_11695 [Burkholderiaceae bacterium]|nr:MAG: hypothetical protein EPO06_11695 [Burkholderiaceae bacterium]